MLFKAYLTYIRSLKDIFLKRHILFNNILYVTKYFVQEHIFLFDIYGLYDIFVQQHIYVFKQHICFWILSNICITCILEQHICDPYVTFSWILPHPSHLSWRSQRTNQYCNEHSNLLFPQNISIVLLRLRSFSEIMCFTYCVHVVQWCRSCATLRGNSDT